MSKLLKIAELVLVCLGTSAAMAQLPGGNIFFGYSYNHATAAAPAVPADAGGVFASGSTGLNGWNASAEMKFLPLLGLVADFSGHYGSQTVTDVCGFIAPPCVSIRENMDSTVYHFLVGPQLSFSIGRMRPFARALLGAGHLSESTKVRPFSASDTAFAYALGGELIIVCWVPCAGGCRAISCAISFSIRRRIIFVSPPGRCSISNHTDA